MTRSRLSIRPTEFIDSLEYNSSQMFNSDSTMVSTKGKNSMLVTKELVEKMTGEYDLRNKHEVKRKVQLQFLRQVIVQLETFLSR